MLTDFTTGNLLLNWQWEAFINSRHMVLALSHCQITESMEGTV